MLDCCFPNPVGVGFGKLELGTGLLGVGAGGVGFWEWFPKQCPAKKKPSHVLVGVGVGLGALGLGVYGPSRFHGAPPKSGVGKAWTGMVPNICWAYACQIVAGHSPP